VGKKHERLRVRKKSLSSITARMKIKYMITEDVVHLEKFR
jgi:hypothetical protein